MKEKKTLTVQSLLDEVNRRNECSVCDPKVREGWNAILETMLMAAGAYHGFRFLGIDEVPMGQDPGINRDGEGVEYPQGQGVTPEQTTLWFKRTDKTRVKYL